MSAFIVANTIWAPWQQWVDENWRPCRWAWHVIYSAATSQSLPIPVPDVLFAVHVSTIWTTALGRRQPLCTVNGHHGRFATCRVITFKKDAHFITRVQPRTHCNMHTNACTDAHAVIQMGLLTGWHIWTWTESSVPLLALFSCTPLALFFPDLFL